ncbi:hypothetical protein THASP1DRAFT_30770 [Thamnocephalis sphaerospora]|uniref:RRM domain-containing protein n=1 Tax=Thamnocephalis sphaerospora TaxID=78915 RepID=A0A4P9XNA7_9FUNG|nr:hypothetical protein THASP1DRAFT_30770 [Thamnocephalis sphaerospora]|eukprot:RKP07406.1 hypothetical protein THASP1DRAFT_30770 [Thamnocephalis sphaerospora]
MADRMDMALDDAIRMDRTTSNRNGNQRRGRRNGNSKGDDGRREGRTERRSAPYARAAVPRGDANARWEHDLYQKAGGRQNTRAASSAAPAEGAGRLFTVSFRGAAAAAAAAGSGGSSSAKTAGQRHLTVTNLFYEVSENDLKELFSQVGALEKVHLRFDRAGRSTGVAEVVYAEANGARRAMERYNNVTLDGQPMRISYGISKKRSDAPSTTVSILSRLGDKATGDDEETRKGTTRTGRGRGNSQGSRRPRGRNAPRERTEPKSLDQLDAELDSYMQMDAPAPDATQATL